MTTSPTDEHRRRSVSIWPLRRVASLAIGVAALLGAAAVATAGPTTTTPPTSAPPTVATTTPTPTTGSESDVVDPDLEPVGSLAGNAECDPASGQTTITWRLANHRDAPIDIVSSTATPFEVDTVDALETVVATEVLDGPDADTEVSNTVTVEADGVQVDLSETVTAAACEHPALPPDVSFTFEVTPSVTTAAIGDTIQYEYCGENLSTIDLEVLRVVDDRLDVLLERSDVATIVPPGATVCSSGLGFDASYVVQPADAGLPIVNNAVLTVRTTEPTPRTFQLSATATVDVPMMTLAAEMTCAGEPADHVYDANNMPTGNLNLGAGDSVVLVSGTFRAGIDGTSGSICVLADAAFEPQYVNARNLNLYVDGAARMSGWVNGTNSSLTNSGQFTFNGNVQMRSPVTNEAGATFSAPNGVSIYGPFSNAGTMDVGTLLVGSGGSLTNNGTVTASSLGVNGASTVDNSGTITAEGSTTIDGTLTNSGSFVSTGEIKLNGSSSTRNTCRIEGASMIVDGPTNNEGIVLAGSSMLVHSQYTQSATGYTGGVDFRNDGGSVRGEGGFRFAGQTTNQGTFAGTSAAQQIYFYDTSQTTGQIFDQQYREPINTVRAEVAEPPAGACNAGPTPPTTTTSTSSTSSTTSTTVPETTTTSTVPETTTTTTTTSTTSTTVPETTTSTTSTTVPETTTTTTTSTTSTTEPDATSTSSTSTSTTEPGATSTSTTTTSTTTSTTSTTVPAEIAPQGASTTTEPSTTTTTTTLVPPPPGITFTFSVEASTAVAAPGETIEYSYCGENTSDVPLEVLRVDDDRFGTLELPDESTVVQPGESICNTDVDLPVTYVVEESDEGTTIVNHAFATVQTPDGQEFQAADQAQVDVPAPPIPPTGAKGIPETLAITLGLLATGGALIAAARREPPA